MPSVADGYPIHTKPGPDANTVVLIHPITADQYPCTISNPAPADKFTRIETGSTNIVVLSKWKPGADLYLSPTQMMEAFPPAPAPAHAAPIDLKSVSLTKPDAVVALPGNPFAVGVGGGYLLLSMREPSRVVVFDVARGKIAATFPIDVGLFHVAGGAERFYVVKPTEQTVDTYSLVTMKREPRSRYGSSLKFHPNSQVVAMGRNSPGPLMLHDSEGLGFTSIDAAQERYVNLGSYGKNFSSRSLNRLSARHDGSTFYLGTDEGPTREFRFVREKKVDENTGTVSYSEYVIEESLVAAKQNIVSRTDGTGLYVYGDRELCFRNGLRVGNRSRFDQIVPCSPAGFWLAAGTPSATESVVGLELFFGADPLPLETLYLIGAGKPSNDSTQLPLRDRIVHFPEQRTLAIVTNEPPSVLLKEFEPEVKLQVARRPTLMVTSTPALPLITRKHKLAYRIKVVATQEPVTFQLMQGPPELKLSADGLVTWQPSSDGRVVPTVSTYALIKISDPSGRHVFERLNLVVKNLYY